MDALSSLNEKYPPSAPCSCETCLAYCKRPGWWTVEEAGKAIRAGYDIQMMLEISPEITFGVLSPAFKGCELAFASSHLKDTGCTFLHDGRCELHGTGIMPIECRFCHHDRLGKGAECHADLEHDWNSPVGKALVISWCRYNNFMKTWNYCL